MSAESFKCAGLFNRHVAWALCFVGLIVAELLLGRFYAGTEQQLLITRAVVVANSLLFVVFAVIFRDATLSTLRSALLSRDSSLNLALFRIAGFGTLYWLLHTEPILPALAGSRTLWSVPFGIGWLFQILPPDLNVVVPALALCKILCLAGAVGLFSRTNALVCACLAIYLFGLAQSIKVTHYHHVVWFLFLLASSKCGDRLSIDALFMPSSAMRSIAYGIPLKFFWLLIGIIYLYPGLGKLWGAGIDWIWSDHLIKILLEKWYIRGWLPDIRVDRLPLLLTQMGALTVIVFECSAIVLLFMGERVRTATAIAAIAFHRLTQAVMCISFFHLQPFLLALINWDRLLRLAGRRFFQRREVAYFQDSCSVCRVGRAAIRSYDVFRRVVATSVLDTGRVGGVDFHAIHSGVGSKAASVVGLLLRVPLAVPLLVTLTMVRSFRAQPLVVPTSRRSRMPLLPVCVGTTLAVFSSCYGLFGVTCSWPFVCYPTFVRPTRGTITTYFVEMVTADGRSHSLDLMHRLPQFGCVRVNSILEKTKGKPIARQRDVLLSLCQTAIKNEENASAVRRMHIYKVRLRLTSDRPKGQIVARQYLFSFQGRELTGSAQTARTNRAPPM